MIAAQAATVVKQRRTVLAAADARFAAGHLHALVGPNGAGKSTLLRAVAGLEPLASGRILVGDRDLGAMTATERARRIAWVPDATTAPFAYTAHETVVMGRFPWHLGLPQDADHRRADEALAELGVEALRDRALTALSSGERQKVMLARALASDAAVLLLDEPTANLDVAAALRLLAVLRARAARGQLVVASLHDISLALRFSDACTCLAGGRVLAGGPTAATLTPTLLRQAFGVEVRIAHTDRGETIPVFDSF